MKNWAAQNKGYFIGAILGALVGFLYWRYIGCLSGTCAITSHPLNSTLYFALLGALFLGLFRKQNIPPEPKKSAGGKRKWLVKKNWFLYGILLAVFFLAAPVAQAQDESGKATGAVSVKKFKRLLKKKSTVLIDVRTPEEYAAGHMPGAVLIDFKKSDFADRIAALDKSRRYLLYCRTGNRSAKATQVFRQRGFAKVYHLDSGTEGKKEPLP